MALGEAAATKGIPCVLYGLKKKKKKKGTKVKTKKPCFLGVAFKRCKYCNRRPN
jgi:hypothetical protein